MAHAAPTRSRSTMLPLILPLAALALALAPARPALAARDNPAAAFDAYLQAAQAVMNFQGTVLVARDGEPVLEKGYGLASRELAVPNTPATRFLIGSVTKQFTAAAILQLQEQGKLSVQDPISRHLPAWPKATGDRVTIHQLLSHTAGIPNYTDDAAVMARRTVEMTLDELCATFRDKPLDFEPGTSWSYSNSGYVILGLVIEAVTGQSYEQYVREHLLEPAGMRDSGYGHLATVIPNRACGYSSQGGTWANTPRVAMSVPYAAGALCATAADLLRWDQALYGDKVLAAASREAMFTPVAQGYGYGQMMQDRFGHREIAHGGGIDGFTTHLARYPDDRLTIIVMCNNEAVDASAIGVALAAIAFGRPYDLPAIKKPAKIDVARLDEYAGAYRIGEREFRLVRRDGDRLTSQRTGGDARPLLPEKQDLFFYEHDHATTLAFERDAQGRVVAHVIHQQGTDTRCERVTGALADSLLAGPAVVAVAPDVFAGFVGEYELAPGFVLSVRQRDTRCFAQATGQQEFEIFPASETEYFLKVVDARLTFERDAAGQATGLVLHQAGRDMPARKIR